MRVTRIRRGFATNSSSMHSILEVEPGQDLPAPLNWEFGREHEEGSFFIVSDRPSRIRYLHAMAVDGARYSGDDWSAGDECYRRYRQLAAVVPGPPLSREEAFGLTYDRLNGSGIPRKDNSPDDMDVGLFERIVRFLMSENIVIYGDRHGYFEPNDGKLKGVHCSLLEGCCGWLSRRVDIAKS